MRPNRHVVRWTRAGTAVPDFPALLAQYPASEFASPRRSTVPLLGYWRSGAVPLAEFSAAIGVPAARSAELHFEFEVPVQAGSGKPSCTDLMVLTESAVVAIEAKSTEPRYAEVATWLGTPAAANRSDVLRGWLGLLQRCCGRRITIDDVGHLPYQLVHRAASACYPAGPRRWLVYQLFEVPALEQTSYLQDLRALADLLGPTRDISIALVACDLQASAAYAELESEWVRGSRDVSGAVVAGLLAGNLIAPQIQSVTAV